MKLSRSGLSGKVWSLGSVIAMVMIALGNGSVQAQNRVVLPRQKATVMLEPYAPNIIRVTLSLRKDDALAAPGYGFIAHPDAAGWTHETTDKGDVYRSSQMVVTVGASHPWTPTGTAADIAKFFNGSTPGVGISFKTPEGKDLLNRQPCSGKLTRRCTFPNNHLQRRIMVIMMTPDYRAAV